MRPKRFSKKLSLNKKTVVNLNTGKMNDIRGGRPSEPGTWCVEQSIPQTVCYQNTCNAASCGPPCTNPVYSCFDISCYSYMYPVCPC